MYSPSKNRWCKNWPSHERLGPLSKKKTLDSLLFQSIIRIGLGTVEILVAWESCHCPRTRDQRMDYCFRRTHMLAILGWSRARTNWCGQQLHPQTCRRKLSPRNINPSTFPSCSPECCECQNLSKTAQQYSSMTYIIRTASNLAHTHARAV